MDGGATPVAGTGEEIEGRFQAAVEFIKGLPSAGQAAPVALSNEDKLRLYSLYKQATEGECTTPQPGFFDMVGRYKWDAWRRLGSLDRRAAMQQYVESLLAKAAQMPPSADLTRFVEAVTPVRRRQQQPPQEQSQPEQPPTPEQPPAQERPQEQQGEEGVAQSEGQLARRLDVLQESVAQETLRTARLESLLAGGAVEAAGAEVGELTETLRLVEVGLREGQREREQLGARLAELERLGERLQTELRVTQAALSSAAWLFAGAALVVPAVVLAASLLARRK